MKPENTYHRTATRATVEPSGQRCGLWTVSSLEEPKPHVHVAANGQISGILIDAFAGLTDTAVVDKFHPGTSSRMFEDIVEGTIPLNEATSVVSNSGSGQSAASQCQTGQTEAREERHLEENKSE